MINQTGYWSGDVDKHHAFDKSLCSAIIEMISPNDRVVDLGCGQGKYVNAMREAGINAIGFDGNPATKNIHYCYTEDLTRYKAGKNADFVISLEVGEHIPKEHTQGYIDCINSFNPYAIIISWAIPGQGGYGHVNELPNEDVIAMFPKYRYRKDLTEQLRAAATLPWFKNTILVLSKK